MSGFRASGENNGSSTKLANMRRILLAITNEIYFKFCEINDICLRIFSSKHQMMMKYHVMQPASIYANIFMLNKSGAHECIKSNQCCWGLEMPTYERRNMFYYNQFDLCSVSTPVKYNGDPAAGVALNYGLDVKLVSESDWCYCRFSCWNGI